MTLDGHNALWYANHTVLGLNGRGSTMVLSDRALATSYRLSIVITPPPAAVWPQFLMESFKL